MEKIKNNSANVYLGLSNLMHYPNNLWDIPNLFSVIKTH